MTDHIELVGTGTVQAAPDLANLRLGVSFPAKTVGDALSGCADLTTQVLTALKALPIDARDLRTTSLSVDPQWHRDKPEIIGHTANQYLNVRIREVSKIGAAISAASAAAGDSLRMDSLTWSVSEPDPLHERARELAFEAAQEKAAQLAHLAGRALGDVLRIGEEDSGGFYGGPSGGARAFKLEAAAADMPAEGGEQEVTATVRVRWRLADRAG